MGKLPFHKSVLLALKGIAYGILKERNLKIQLLIGIIVVIISLLLKISRAEFIIILFVCFFVIALELLNTALEKLIDSKYPDYDKDIGRIKDILAGVVLLAVILSVITGILILANPVIDFFKTII